MWSCNRLWNEYKPFHGKTYNLDWRHNLLKRRCKLAGKNSWRVQRSNDACVLLQLVICLFFGGFQVFRHQKNGNILLFKEVLEMMVYPSGTNFKSRSYIGTLLLHYEQILTSSLLSMTSYLCNKPECGPNISDYDHLKCKDNFCAKKWK